MAFSIVIGIKQNSYNSSSNSSNVTVSYTLKWSGGTWNWEKPGAGITIDGQSYEFYPSLNPRKTTSGSECVWSKELTINHGSSTTKTLNVSAYFNWRNVRASTSKTLGTMSSSSSGSTGGGGSSSTSSTSSKAVITKLAVQKGTERTLYATWTWDKDNTENYEVEWYYATGDGIWFIGNDSTTEKKQDTYTPPENATKVKVQVKPISKKHTVNDQETSYWTASWSTAKEYNLSDAPPLAPPVPTVEISDSNKSFDDGTSSGTSDDGSTTTELADDILEASLDNLDVNADTIQFQIVKDDKSVFNTGTATIITSSARYSCAVDKNSRYKVRCRSKRGSEYSEWSDYSENIESSPSAPNSITVCKAVSGESIYLEWEAVPYITSYDIEYTTKKDYFGSSDGTTVVSSIEATHYLFTKLSPGTEYFFRVRCVNDQLHSAWSGISSVIIGKAPSAPTTWSSATVACIGDEIRLYWVHNSEDGSSQTYADLELYLNDEKQIIEMIKNTEDEDLKDKTSVYVINTAEFETDTVIRWRVRTAGIAINGPEAGMGDWSVERTIEVYARPTLDFGVTDLSGALIDQLTSFPFYISGIAGPNTQAPIGYHVSVVSNSAYETVDEVGHITVVNAGDEVYSKHFDTADVLLVEMSANNVNLENNIVYTVVCTVYMNTGLETSASSDFTVAWTDVMHEPNAEIGVDTTAYTASIRPYCVDRYNRPISDVMLSVYRREFDGSFTKLAGNLDNTRNTFVTDPHPALDYARYRVVATTKSTGAVSYYDVPGYPIGGKAVVIQWNETWSNFDIVNPDRHADSTWSGSMLKLPYNIDVSDSNDADVSLIEYIGRKYPVSYYGTQVGSKSTWNVSVPKSDKETLYGLRRLAAWMGDVYVREPSASGYWAQIAVSFSQKHKDLVVPVTLSITRVEGGV